MISSCATGSRGTPLANVVLASEPDVRPRDIRPNRNAARENETCDRSLHNNPAGRRKILVPDGARDDPRTRAGAADSQRSAAFHAASLASDAFVPVEPHDLSRWRGTAAGLSTAASDARLPGTSGCNSNSGHRTVESDGRTPSAGSCANRCDRSELVSPNVLEHLEGGPRELLSRKVKSRIEAATSIRGDFFNAGILAQSPPLHDNCGKSTQPPAPLLAIRVWLTNPDHL